MCTLFLKYHNTTGFVLECIEVFIHTSCKSLPLKLKLTVNILAHLHFSVLLPVLFHTTWHLCSCSPLVFFYLFNFLLFFSALLFSQLWPSKGLLVPTSWRRKNEMFGEKQGKKIPSNGARGKLILELRQVYAQRQMCMLWIKWLKKLQTQREDLSASDHPQSSLSLQQTPHETVQGWKQHPNQVWP